MKGVATVVTPVRPTILIGSASPDAPAAYSVTNLPSSFTTHKWPAESKATPSGPAKAVSHPPIDENDQNGSAAAGGKGTSRVRKFGVGRTLPVSPELYIVIVPMVTSGLPSTPQ